MQGLPFCKVFSPFGVPPCGGHAPHRADDSMVLAERRVGAAVVGEDTPLERIVPRIPLVGVG